MRTLLVVTTGIALLSGCYTHRPVSRVDPKQHVRIAFGAGSRDVTVITRNGRRVTVPHVKHLSGRVLRIRGDTVEVRVDAMEPWEEAMLYSTALLPQPNPDSRQVWDARAFSGGRTAALILAFPAVGLLALIIYVGIADPMGGGT